MLFLLSMLCANEDEEITFCNRVMAALDVQSKSDEDTLPTKMLRHAKVSWIVLLMSIRSP